MKKDLNGRIYEVSKKISGLEQERKELLKLLIEEQKEKLKPLVGMAFQQEDRTFVISGVPKERGTMTGTEFNPYQLPVIVVAEESESIIRIEEDTIFSKAIGSEDAKTTIRKEYQEIPLTAFKEKLMRACQDIWDATTF